MVAVVFMNKGGKQKFELRGDSLNEDTILGLLKSEQVEIIDAWAILDHLQVHEVEHASIGMLRGVIDIALDIGDEEWFEQLVSRLNWDIRSVGSDSSVSSNQ